MALPLSTLQPNYLQTLGAVAGFMDRAKAHFETENVPLQEIVETRLFHDMLPFSFQIASVAHHSLGALKGVEEGAFAPPSGPAPNSWDDLRQLIADTISGVKAMPAARIDSLEGRDVIFKLGQNNLPFTAEGFLLSFSLPNFYFHAATAYDILRMKGAPLGKRDFIGQLRMKM